MGLLKRRSVRVLLGVVAVLAVAVLAIRILLPAEKIRDLALDQARQRLGREVSVGDVSVSLRGGLGVRLADFAIQNPDGFAGEPLLTARGLDLKLAIRPLLSREVRVHRLVLDGPVLHLVRRADGTDNFTFAARDSAGAEGAAPAPVAPPPPGAADGSPPTAPPPLSVASLTLSDGLVDYRDESAPETGFRGARVEGIDLGLTLDDPAPGVYRATGRLAAARIAVTAPGEVPDLDADIAFTVAWDNAESRLDIEQAAATILGLPLAATGAITMPAGAPAPSGDLRVELSAQPVAGFRPFLPAPLAGKLAGDESSGTVDATVDVTLTGSSAVPVHTRGAVNARDVDLALAQPFLPPGQPGRLAGRGDFSATFADTTGDPDRIAYAGEATVRGASYTESGLVDELQDLDATVRFTPDVFTVTKCEAAFASGRLSLTGDLRDPFPYFLPPEMQAGKAMKTPHLSFELRSPKLDVDRLLPAASPAGGPGAGDAPAGGGQAAAGARRTAVPAGVEFPDLTSAGTFRADTVVYMAVPLTNVTGKVTIAERQLHVHDVTADVYQGRVEGQVDIDLNDLNDPGYAGTYAARDIEVNNFVTRFADMAGVVFGGCNLSGDFAARGLDPEAIRNSLTLDASALLAQGRVVTGGQLHDALSSLAARTGGSFDREQTLRDLATRIKVEDGRVGLDALTTRLGRFADVTVDGSYAFSGGLDYRGALLLTEAETDRLFNQGGVMGELAKLLGSQRPKRLEIPLTVGGTRTKPTVKIETSAVLDDLQQAAVREQGDKLEDEVKGKVNDLLRKWKK